MKRRGRRLMAVALVSVTALGACDDGDDESATGDTTTTLSAQVAAFCADVVTANTLEPDIPEDASEEEQMARGQQFFQSEYLPLNKEIQRAAPASAKGAVDEIVRFFEEKGPQAFEDDAFSAIALRANQAAATACNAGETRVTATDYAFAGMPPTFQPGYRLFRLTNMGSELHEMIFLRKKATTTESFDEIFLLGSQDQAAAEAKLEEAGAVFAFPAGPGSPQQADASAFLNLTPGQYAIACFIPVGLTPQAAQAAEETGQEPQGPPHVARGMKAEFTVS